MTIPRFVVRALQSTASRCVVSTAGLFFAVAALHAAVPPDGTLPPTAGSKVEWDGFGAILPAGGLAREDACIDGTNCDVFTIHVGGQQGEWAGKSINVKITFALGDDFDLYIRKDSVTGPPVASGVNGGPADGDGVSEQAVINPATTGVGDYVVHVLYSTFLVPGNKYHGVANVIAAQGPEPGKQRSANYILGGVGFSPNRALKAPANFVDGEPSCRTDFQGNFYTGGIRGFPAGVDLWYNDLRRTLPDGSANPAYDPTMRVPFYRGQPDGFSPTSEGDLGGDGGGDIDLAVGFGLPAGQTAPTLAFSSLIVGNLSTGNSTNRAESYNKNPLGNVPGGPPGDDRQWHEFLGANTVYMLYRTLQPAVTQFQRSDDGGVTYGPTATAGAIGQVGSLDVHQATGVVYGSGGTGRVAVGIPSVPGLAPTSLDYTTYQAASDPNAVDHKFFVVKVAEDGTPNGTLYVCYSNQVDVFIKHSTDQGKTWSDPVKVNGAINTKVNIFPWMETGALPGSVAVAWYGTDNSGNNDAAEWKVYFAQTFDATATAPTFRVAEVTEPEHVIHASNISESGLDPTGTGVNRNLLDYFQLSIDPQGAAVVSYTDDHNDYTGVLFAARQVSGPSLNTGQPLPAQTEGADLRLPAETVTVKEADAIPPRQPGFNGEQVTDFAEDIVNGVLTRVRQAHPADILSVRYDTSGTGESLAIAATFRVSDLTVVENGSSWRASFAVNAPHSVLSADGTYSYGASDHADQFYVQASTPVGGPTFTYGKAVRASSGSITYTSLGPADTGIINQDDQTISIQISVAKLNAVLAAAGHPLIQNGTVVTGLRGHSSAGASGAARADDTYGGTQFVVHDSAFPYPPADPQPTPLPLPPSPRPTPPDIELKNIATRVAVQTGQNGVAGFIKRTSAAKRVLIRAIGPSLNIGGTPLAGTIQDPIVEIFNEAGTLIASNDNWRGPQQAEITASGLAPTHDNESAVIVNLGGSAVRNSFTAQIKGAAGSQGIGVVEVYDLDATSFADLGNLSTLGFVGTGNDVLIGGFIVRDDSGRNQSQTILLRGIGPSLSAAGVGAPLADPSIDLRDGQGNSLATNNDWQSSPDAAAIQATTAAPSDPKESAILKTLAPGGYTLILKGADNGTGVGVVEAYNLGNQ